jgi:hypothetical protein
MTEIKAKITFISGAQMVVAQECNDTPMTCSRKGTLRGPRRLDD